MNKQRVFTILFVSLSIAFLDGCASMFHVPVTHTMVKPEEFVKRFTPEELRDDLSMLMETLEAVHPNLYAYTPKAEVDSLRRTIDEGLTTPLTRAEFYFKVAPLVAQIGDGHTNVDVPWEEFSQYRSNGGLAFPFNVAYDTLDGLTIARNYSGDSTLAVGDRILSINGSSADSLAAVYLRGFSGERMTFRQQRLAGAFRMLLWLDKILSPYDLIVWSKSSEDRIAKRVAGVTVQVVLHTDSLLSKNNAAPPNYCFERLTDNIGYIDFRAMVDDQKFSEFLTTTFTDIHVHPVRGLITDLRNNGGGSSRLGDDLLSFITDSSYRLAARKEWKMSAQYKAYLLKHVPWWIRWFPFTWVIPEARKYLGAHDGEIVVDTALAERHEANRLRYSGKECFLIGPRTFSSAMMLANAVGDYRLATLIGEETGGIPNAYGDIYPFDLPNTKLSVTVSSAYFVRANGDEKDRRGVMPDIEVRQTQEDARAGRDTVLERARQWVLNGR